MKPEDYTAVRVGMNATEAIIDGRVDAAIGLENVQTVCHHSLFRLLSTVLRPSS